jgi:hypothetical protein
MISLAKSGDLRQPLLNASFAVAWAIALSQVFMALEAWMPRSLFHAAGLVAVVIMSFGPFLWLGLVIAIFVKYRRRGLVALLALPLAATPLILFSVAIAGCALTPGACR